MKLSDYQRQALLTDQLAGRGESIELTVPLLGLAGEVGGLLAEYKKKLRDGDAYSLYEEKLKEELGDILWYLANVASHAELSLEEIAAYNIDKVNERWLPNSGNRKLSFDEGFPENERLPRVFRARFTDDGRKVSLEVENELVGDRISDNAYEDIGYRFHDVFHLGFAAILGWSPVLRKLLRKKRKSRPIVDEVEDGARACITEEAIAAFVFRRAQDRNFFPTFESIDWNLLRTVRDLVRGLEVEQCSAAEWQQAIHQSCTAYNDLHRNKGGSVVVDLDARMLRLAVQD